MDRVEQLLDRDGFLYGIVAPWFESDSYGCDMGRDEPRGLDCKFRYHKVKELFYNCKAVGFNCVRLWLFEIMEGIAFDDDGFAKGLDPEMWRNIHTILELAESMDLYLIVTFQPHISFSLEYPDPYRHYTKIIHSPEHVRSFTENVIAPLSRLFGTCNHVLMLDIYAEPEGDTLGEYGNRIQPYGGTWEQMRHYIRSVAKTIRENAPGMPVTACSGWQEYKTLRAGLYNNLDLDYIGVDIYNDPGTLAPVDTLGCTKPVWLAEFGPETKYNWDDDFSTRNALAFYENAVQNGYIGAFFWMYGFANSTNREALMLLNTNGKLRGAADHLRPLFHDGIQRHRYGMVHPEPPAFTSFTDCRQISWFGSRMAKCYWLERSEDRCQWTCVAVIAAVSGQSRYEYDDSTAKPGEGYYYRVAAIFEGGGERYSFISCRCKNHEMSETEEL